MTIFEMYKNEKDTFFERLNCKGLKKALSILFLYNPLSIFIAVGFKSKFYTSHNAYLLTNYCERVVGNTYRF